MGLAGKAIDRNKTLLDMIITAHGKMKKEFEEPTRRVDEFGKDLIGRANGLARSKLLYLKRPYRWFVCWKMKSINIYMYQA